MSNQRFSVLDAPRRNLLVFTGIYLLALIGFVGWRVVVRSERGWIGMTYKLSMDSNPAMRGTLIVDGVIRGSPADKAGIREGEWLFLRQFNGAPVSFRSDEPGAPAGPRYVFEDLAKRVKVGNVLDFGRLVVVESPFKCGVVLSNLLVSILTGIAILAASFWAWWREPQDGASQAFYVICCLAAGYYCVDGLRPFDSEVDLGLDRLFTAYDIVWGILWFSRFPPCVALPFLLRGRRAEGRGPQTLFLLGVLLAVALIVLQRLYPAESMPVLLVSDVYAKAPFVVFLACVAFGILRYPPKQVVATAVRG